MGLDANAMSPLFSSTLSVPPALAAVKCVFLFCAVAAALAPAARAAEPRVRLNEAEYRDRVLACWMGKNIGGTLGMPVEGQHGPHNFTYYTNLKQGEAAPNDDIDLQLLWLKALEEHDGRVDARILGEYWLKYVPVDWNEYGVGKRNMRLGLLPPLSGEWENAQWKHSNGALVRSEIWACLYPGLPALAARMAREDGCVDHGAGEGTLAEIFMAAVESAAFVEPDRDKLIGLGLAAIPEKCGLARAVKAALEAKAAGKDWKAAREAVIEASKATGWFQAPRNLGFIIIGWIYGDGDFGKSLCTAVNCGDDTDSTGASLGALLGILGGTKAIPAKWREPIGDKIKTVAVGGFKAFGDIHEFTDHTVAMAKKVLAEGEAAGKVAIVDGPADLAGASGTLAELPEAAKALWDLSPYKVTFSEADDVYLFLDYQGDPVIQAGLPREIRVAAAYWHSWRSEKTNSRNSESMADVHVTVGGLGPGWRADIGGVFTMGSSRYTSSVDLTLFAPAEAHGVHRMWVEVTLRGKKFKLPLTLIVREPPPKVEEGDLALASKGAAATADSELAREPGCTPKAIDGVICGPEDFETNRWHSSIETQHPHWIQVKLPKPTEIGRVVIRFADPKGYAVKFQGLVAAPDGKGWTEVLRQENNQESRTFRATFRPVVTDAFRLVIEKSANPAWPTAAQLSEIEIYAR
jgi:ADP-ribosylglycohydrolase